MNEIFEKLFFYKFEYKNNQFFLKKKKFLMNFFFFSELFVGMQELFLFILNDKKYYDEFVHIDFRIDSIRRLIAFSFFFTFINSFIVRNYYQKYLAVSNDFKLYKFLFLVLVKDIKKEIKVEKKFAVKILQNNSNFVKLIRIIFPFYDIIFIFFIGEMAYSKLNETGFILVLKVILYIHLFYTSLIAVKLYVFIFIKTIFVLSYLRIKLKDLKKKFLLILKLYQNELNSKKINCLVRRQILENKILREFQTLIETLKKKKKLYKKVNLTFNPLFIVTIVLLFLYLNVIVFYYDVNLDLALFLVVIYLNFIFGFILPFIIFNFKLNQQVSLLI